MSGEASEAMEQAIDRLPEDERERLAVEFFRYVRKRRGDFSFDEPEDGSPEFVASIAEDFKAIAVAQVLQEQAEWAAMSQEERDAVIAAEKERRAQSRIRDARDEEILDEFDRLARAKGAAPLELGLSASFLPCKSPRVFEPDDGGESERLARKFFLEEIERQRQGGASAPDHPDDFAVFWLRYRHLLYPQAIRKQILPPSREEYERNQQLAVEEMSSMFSAVLAEMVKEKTGLFRPGAYRAPETVLFVPHTCHRAAESGKGEGEGEGEGEAPQDSIAPQPLDIALLNKIARRMAMHWWVKEWRAEEQGQIDDGLNRDRRLEGGWFRLWANANCVVDDRRYAHERAIETLKRGAEQ